MDWILLVVFGIIGGVLGGMGMGGGTLLIPLLTIFLNIPQQGAQAINLIAFLHMSIFALIIHAKNNLLNFKIAIPVAISGVLSALLGSVLAGMTDSSQLSLYFGIFLIVIGVFQITSIFFKKTRYFVNKK